MTTKQSIPHTNQDKRSCPHNDRFHIQSVNLIDRSTLVYNNVGAREIRETWDVNFESSFIFLSAKVNIIYASVDLPIKLTD